MYIYIYTYIYMYNLAPRSPSEGAPLLRTAPAPKNGAAEATPNGYDEDSEFEGLGLRI